MKIWIHLNGIQQGPYSKEEIAAMNLPAATPVWYEGLPQWIPACQASELADIFGDAPATSASEIEAAQEAADVVVETVYASPASANRTQAAYGRGAYGASAAPRRPATYLAWSILLTLCCCTPFSIAAIVTGAIANARYSRGDYRGARRMSHATEWLVILSITFAIVGMPLSILAAMM